MFYNHVIEFVKESRRISAEKLNFSENASAMGHYIPKQYNGLNVCFGVGKGNWAGTTWIAFPYPGQSIQQGIYPVFLYYRKQDTLILAFGISEKEVPIDKWPDDVYKKNTVKQYFFNEQHINVDKYKDSIVGKTFVGTEIDSINIPEEDRLLDQFLNYYINFMQNAKISIKKDVDWSFLTDGFTLSKNDAIKLQNNLKVRLVKGASQIIKIIFNDVEYSAKFTYVNHSDVNKNTYQIRFDGSELMKSLQQYFARQYQMVSLFKQDPQNKNAQYVFPDGYKAYVIIESTSDPTVYTMEGFKEDDEVFTLSSLIESFAKDIKPTGLKYSDDLLSRFILSLTTKPFVILSGLAGSGKTQLAISFARWIAKSNEQICVVPVGADWNNRDYLLGYPNALSGEYVPTDTLTLIENAIKHENENLPYFLILDEMNLSYVERYFADFLSAIESNETISLAKGKTIQLPQNLYVIGTINVDETTYMFSPKVLDRANVIEFRVQEDEMTDFLKNLAPIEKSSLYNSGQKFGQTFVQTSKQKDISLDSEAADTLSKFFNELKKVNAEFGYRTASEMFRFISLGKTVDKDSTWLIDAAIIQKLLPKLHGSRKKVENVLKTLWNFCLADGVSTPLDTITTINKNDLRYKLAGDKIYRMYKTAIDNGFTSYAEA